MGIIELSIQLDDIIQSVIKRIYDERLQAGDIDAELWRTEAEGAFKEVAKGLGVPASIVTQYNKPSALLAKNLQRNLFTFYAFKGHHQVQDMIAALTDPITGAVRTWADFKTAALSISANYNLTWLKAEYETAYTAAEMAGKWQTFEQNKKHLPILEYSTVGDARVRPAHAALDGTRKHIDDPFWDVHYPPNGWGCRCTIIATSDDEPEQEPTRLPDEKELPPAFRFNPGKTHEAFSLQHPYFTTVQGAPRTKLLKAAAHLIFDQYADGDYFKGYTPELYKAFRAAKNHPDVFGYDDVSGGFVVAHKGHSAAGYANELPVCKILKDKGELLELIDESHGTNPVYDLYWRGKFWDIKRVTNMTDVKKGLHTIFKDAKKKGKNNLLLHIEIPVSKTKLKDALYHALRQSKSIEHVTIVNTKGEIIQLTAELIKNKSWK